jgi:hypothetical protein
MKKLLLGTLLLALFLGFPAPLRAAVDVGVSISLPLIVFSTPPVMVVIPETNVYAVPDQEMEIFFHGGWWWRPWQGRWYRSRHHDSGWARYGAVPSFYRGIPSGWRNDYRERRWKGREWNHKRVSHQQVQQNWRGWEKDKHWEKQDSWGVKDLKRRSPSRTAAKQKPSQNKRGKPEKGQRGKD